MIVFDLACREGNHSFEGWFGSSQDFADQQARGLIACPVCGSSQVEKAVMAPAIGRKGNQRSAVPPAASASVPASDAPVTQQAGALPTPIREALVALAAAQAKMLPKSRWVGERFADKARAIHYGEADAELIHGRTSDKEARALHEEGITIAPLLVPFVPPEEAN